MGDNSPSENVASNVRVSLKVGIPSLMTERSSDGGVEILQIRVSVCDVAGGCQLSIVALFGSDSFRLFPVSA